MIVWFHIFSALAGLGVALVLVIKLVAYPEQFRFVERLGMGMVGGSMILRIGPILASPETTPFSDWSTTVLQVGILFMVYGRLVRLRRHAKANERAVDAARAWRDGKG